MKNWLFILIAALTCFTLTAEEPTRVESLSSKLILQSSEGYFVLSDRSCWKAVGFSKRWRSPSEWWNNVQLAPERYDCVPNDWYLGARLEIYPKYDNLDVAEANASNEATLRQCTHLLVNQATGKTLFAIALEPAECMVKLFAEAHQEGYDQGFQQGRLKGYQNSTEIYNSGHADGYKSGYAAGYQDAQRGEQRRN